jgi:hypothetical protein
VCVLTSVRGPGDTTTPLGKIGISIGVSGWRGCDDFKWQRKLGNRSSCLPSASILGASSLSLSLSGACSARMQRRAAPAPRANSELLLSVVFQLSAQSRLGPAELDPLGEPHPEPGAGRERRPRRTVTGPLVTVGRPGTSAGSPSVAASGCSLNYQYGPGV